MSAPIPEGVFARMQRACVLAAEISQLGRWHVFFHWSGHIQCCSTYANPATCRYVEGEQRERAADLTVWIGDADAEQQLDRMIETLETLR